MSIERDRFKHRSNVRSIARVPNPAVQVRDISDPIQKIAPQPLPVLNLQPEFDHEGASAQNIAPMPEEPLLRQAWVAPEPFQPEQIIENSHSAEQAIVPVRQYPQISSVVALVDSLFDKLLSINFRWPRWPKIISRAYRRLGKRLRIGIAIFLATIIIGIASYYMLQPSVVASSTMQSGDTKLAVQGGSDSVSGLANTPTPLVGSAHTTVPANNPAPQLAFTPVAPASEPELASLGSKAFNAAHNSYTFRDLFMAEPLQVSEQPLPGGYATPTSVVDNIASSMKASDSIDTTSGPAYMVTNPKTGLQTVIFSTKGLLIFVQTAYRQDAASWSTYLNSLQ